MSSGPGGALSAGGLADLPLCVAAAAALHAALLLWPGAGGSAAPARLELLSGDISVEVSLAEARPSPAAEEPVPLEVPEPERPALPEPVRDPEPPAPESDWPDDLAASPRAAAVPIEVPAAPPELLAPPPAPRTDPASRGTSGNLEAGLARHYVRHPDEGRRKVREATIRLRLKVLASGRVGEIRVLASSGHADLDAAAVRGLERASCVPAMRAGRPVDSDLEISVQFRERRGRAATD